MASIDTTANINRIIEILKNDTALSAIIRNFQFGEDNYEVHDGVFPYILVTTPNQMITTNDTFGIGDNSSDVQTTTHYQIKCFVLGNDSENAEIQKYDILKLIIDILRNNPRLKDPVLENDPKCIRSKLLPAENNEKSRGKENQGFTITLQCQIGDTIQLVYDGLTISVLEEVNSLHAWTTTNHSDDDGLIDVAPTFLEEKKIFKIETNPIIQSTLRTKIRNIGLFPATITKNGIARVISSSMLTRISDSVVYDQISQAVIQLNIIKNTS